MGETAAAEVGGALRVGIALALGLLLGLALTQMMVPQAWCEGWCAANGYGGCLIESKAEKWTDPVMRFDCLNPGPAANPLRRSGTFE